MKYAFILCLVLFCSALSYSASNTTYNPANINDMEKSKLNFNGQKVMGTIPALSTNNIDLTMTDDVLLTGARAAMIGKCDDDEFKFQVLMGSTVVNEFIDWYAYDIDKELRYPAKIPAGLTLRVVYKNTCASNSVKIYINYSLHKILI